MLSPPFSRQRAGKRAVGGTRAMNGHPPPALVRRARSIQFGSFCMYKPLKFCVVHRPWQPLKTQPTAMSTCLAWVCTLSVSVPMACFANDAAASDSPEHAAARADQSDAWCRKSAWCSRKSSVCHPWDAARADVSLLSVRGVTCLCGLGERRNGGMLVRAGVRALVVRASRR